MISAPGDVSDFSGVPVEVREVGSKRDLDSFVTFPLSLYRHDRLFAPQLTRDMKVHFSRENPFFRTAEVRLFLALRGGSVVGRIVSIVNHHHVAYHGEKAGFFGFFESVNDRAVAGALVAKVSEVLTAAGMEIMRGPMNFSTNEECGFLVEGFQSPAMLLTPYNPPYYADLMGQCGMGRSKDLFAYIYEVLEELPDKVLRVASLAERRGITVRRADKKHFVADMRDFGTIYNAAWRRNWGFIPLTDEELLYSADRLKQLVVPDLVVIAEDRGEPVGFLGMVPDFNYVLRRMHGALNPLTILKALYYSRKIPDLRLLLLGITEKYRNRGVDALLFREGFKGVKRGRYKRVEFSWILEDNVPIIRTVEMIGGKLYKRYRVYEKRIA
jgi:hypothetical protein